MSERDELRKLVERWRTPYPGASFEQNVDKAIDDERKQCTDELESLLSAPEAAPPAAEPLCNCGADRTGPTAEEHLDTCPAAEPLDYRGELLAIDSLVSQKTPRAPNDFRSVYARVLEALGAEGPKSQVQEAEPPAGEDWALQVAREYVVWLGGQKYLMKPLIDRLYTKIRTAAEREWAKTEAEMCEKYELALRERERKARLDEAQWWQKNGLCMSSQATVERIRALSTNAGEEGKK